MKKHWTKVLALAVAACALVGQSVIGYVTENGQLPPWMPEKLGGIAGWLSTELGIPIWSVILILAVMIVVVWLFTRFQSRVVRKQHIIISDDNIKLVNVTQRCSDLNYENEELRLQIHTLLEEIETKNAALGSNENLVLAFLASLEDMRGSGTMDTLENTGLGRLKINAALDKLIIRKFVGKNLAYAKWIYYLTPSGRAHYIEHVEPTLQISNP